MAKKSRLVDGILIGALVGAAVSMLHRETREHTIERGKKLKDKTMFAFQNPDVVTATLKEKYEDVRTTIEQVSEDVAFLAGKVEQLKEVTPPVMEIVQDTKEAFTTKAPHDHEEK
ncbi:YtxH domain-containing protein [Metabacillus iocasae]|uniref:Gas vesicle protein n=1 Tax=Priestia iocasae TaxID=2291674 RepID=A0ABS2QZ95_9BACI|nr:YtxH domain-containing protein [Metabacillus iocasae]MBM7704317.1 gas vesicle protein [Metabacillus iocasae]